MSELTEDRVREIVEEVLAGKETERHALSQAETAIFCAGLRARVEAPMEELRLPATGPEREALEKYLDAISQGDSQ